MWSPGILLQCQTASSVKTPCDSDIFQQDDRFSNALYSSENFTTAPDYKADYLPFSVLLID